MRIRLYAPPRIGSPCKNSELFIFAGVAESADALDSGSSECKFMRVQVPSPAPKQKRVATAALFCFKERDLNPERVRAKRKQSGGLFSARSGEPETVACDGRRAMSMQGGAAADGKSLLLHQRKKSRIGGSFCILISVSLYSKNVLFI